MKDDAYPNVEQEKAQNDSETRSSRSSMQFESMDSW